MLNRLRSFVQWVGAGRALTKTRELRVSEARELVDLLQIDRSYVDKVRSSVDLPDVSLIVAWAKAARLVRGAKGTLVPIKSAAPLFNKPLELYRRVFEAFDQLGIYVCRGGGNRADISLLEQAFEDVMPSVWLGLYTAGGTPVPMELLHEIVRTALHCRYEFLPENIDLRHDDICRDEFRRGAGRTRDAGSGAAAAKYRSSGAREDRRALRNWIVQI